MEMCLLCVKAWPVLLCEGDSGLPIVLPTTTTAEHSPCSGLLLQGPSHYSHLHVAERPCERGADVRTPKSTGEVRPMWVTCKSNRKRAGWPTCICHLVAHTLLRHQHAPEYHLRFLKLDRRRKDAHRFGTSKNLPTRSH